MQQSGQRKPKHSTASLTGRSRLADWPKYLSDDLGRMRQESRANPLQPTAWHERLHTAERRNRSWRGFGDRPGSRKKRRSSDLIGLAPPQEPDPELLIGSAQRRQRKRSVQKTDGKCFIGRGGLHRRLRQSCVRRPRARRHEETPFFPQLTGRSRQPYISPPSSLRNNRHSSNGSDISRRVNGNVPPMRGRCPCRRNFGGLPLGISRACGGVGGGAPQNC